MDDKTAAEQKVKGMVIKEGRTLKNALHLGGLTHYTSRGAYRNDYNRLRREIEAEKNEKKNGKLMLKNVSGFVFKSNAKIVGRSLLMWLHFSLQYLERTVSL